MADPIRLPPRRAKLHYTFDNNSLEEIGKTNFALLSKLNSIATRAPVFGEGTATKKSPPKLFKPRGATERERRAAQIDRDNLILLRKIQSTKPEVTKFTRGGISVRNQPWGLEGAQDPAASPTKRERPKWVDSTSSEVPVRPGAAGGSSRREAAGGGSGAVSGRTRTFKDPANIAMDACPEKHLLGKER